MKISLENNEAAVKTEPRLKDDLKSLTRLAALIIFLFFGVFGGWMAYAPLSQGALATGNISPDGHRRTIQHLEGGIIRSLAVKEGESVKRGDVLLTLRPVKALSEYTISKNQLLSQLAEFDRLVAEKNKQGRVIFDDRLEAGSNLLDVRKIKEEQILLFNARVDVDKSRQDILLQKIKQLDQSINGVQKLNISLDKQFSLVEQEIAGVRVLFEKGLERKPRLLSLQRVQAQIIGRKGENNAEISRSNEESAAAKLEIIEQKLQRRGEISTRLSELSTKIAEAEQFLITTKDALERTVLRAPVEGVVINTNFATIGGIIKPGEDILDIVPLREKLVIEAKISPYDIDMVQTGASAKITLLAYPQRTTPTIPGTVEWVSADAKIDEGSQDSYYSARVLIEQTALSKLPKHITLLPGMPVQAMIKSRETTMLDYLIEPLITSVRRSFIEG